MSPVTERGAEAGRGCLEERARPCQFSSRAGRSQGCAERRVAPGAACWCLLGLVLEMVLECLRSPPRRGNVPVQRAWQVKGRRWPLGLPEQLPWSMMQTVAGRNGAT